MRADSVTRPAGKERRVSGGSEEDRADLDLRGSVQAARAVHRRLCDLHARPGRARDAAGTPARNGSRASRPTRSSASISRPSTPKRTAKPAFRRKVLEIARREGRFEGEGWRVRKDGTRFWASVVIDRIRDDDGELLGFAKITRDMTEKRAAAAGAARGRAALPDARPGRHRLRDLHARPGGQVTNWNAGAERIKGYSPDEIIGEHFTASTPRGPRRRRAQRRRSRPRARPAATKPKAGACARTAPASGRAS